MKPQTPPTLKELERFAFYVNGDIKVCLSKDIAEKIKLLRDFIENRVYVRKDLLKELDEIMGDFG